MQPTALIKASARAASVQKHKAARMDEWSQLPLRGWSDMEHWMTAMSDQFVIKQSGNGVAIPEIPSGGYAVSVSPAQDNTRNPGVGMEAQVPSGMYAWQPGNEMYGCYETRLRPPGARSPVYSRGQAPPGSEAIASPAGGLPEDSNILAPGESSHVRVDEDGQVNRAEELSKSKPSIYF